MRTTRTSGAPGPDSQEHEQDSFARAENFARAVDGGIRRTADPILNHELAVVAALRRAGARVGPDSAERDRMRRRLMAEFSSAGHEDSSSTLSRQDADSQILGSRTSRLDTSTRRSARRRTVDPRTSGARISSLRRSGLRISGLSNRLPDEAPGRFLVAAAAALCLLMSLSGMSWLLSREALPGDALYAVKRSAESAELGLTFGEENKAHKHLEFAHARVREIEAMADHADASGTWSTREGEFLRVLEDFELDTTAATRRLTHLAASGQHSVLTHLHGWVEQQETRLQTVRGALPLPASTRLDSTLELLDRVSTRVAALDRRSHCLNITSGAHDELGLLPARAACEPLSAAPAAMPQPEHGGELGMGPSDSLAPPGLLDPLVSGVPAPATGQLGLPAVPDGVLPTPGGPGSGPAQPGIPDGSAPHLIPPLPLPGIPLLPLLPLENPALEGAPLEDTSLEDPPGG